MKFNWGTGIALFFTSFVLFIFFMMYKCFQTDFDLVTEDYYAKELAYQNTIDKIKNEKALGESLQVLKSEKGVSLVFPEDHASIGVSGTVQFFRPSDKDLDKTFEFKNEKTALNFPFSNFKTGAYKVIIDWEANGKSFYKEQMLVF